MKVFRGLAVGLLALFPGVLAGQDGVKPINPVPPLADPTKKPDAPKPLPKPPALPATPGNPAPSIYYSSSFDQNELGKEWKLVNPDPERWTMQPKRKSIMVITQQGACPDSKAGKNQLILDKELPSEDFEVIVKIATHFQGRGSFAQMALVKDDANYFRAVLQREGDDQVYAAYFQKIFQGQVAGTLRADATDQVYLKIDREGNEFSGYYASIEPAKPTDADQVQWVKLGTLPWIRFQGKLILCAANFEAVSEVSAEFFSVVIRKK